MSDPGSLRSRLWPVRCLVEVCFQVRQQPASRCALTGGSEKRILWALFYWGANLPHGTPPQFLPPPKKPTAIPPQSGIYDFNLWIQRRGTDIQNKVIGLPRLAVVVKNPPARAGDLREAGSIPGLGRSPGGGNDSPLQYSYLENPTGRGAWQTTCS